MAVFSGPPDKDACQEELDIVSDAISQGRSQSRWPGMTYEQGIEAALRWVLGEESEAPYSTQ